MFERCEEKTAELLLDVLLEKGIIVEGYFGVDGGVAWGSCRSRPEPESETTSREVEHQVGV
jgi:hypothetical protein